MKTAYECPYRLTAHAYDVLLDLDAMPGRAALTRFIDDEIDSGRTVKGRSKKDFGNLVARRGVTRDYAEAVRRFLNLCATRRVALREALLFGSEADQFDRCFELIPADGRPATYRYPDRDSDPMIRGFAFFSRSAAIAVANLANQHFHEDSERCYLDPDTGPEEYDRHIYIKIGHQLSPRNERLNEDQAYKLGLSYVGKDIGDLEARDARRLIDINPDFIRWALTPDGERIGVSTVHPLTDEAFQATVDGTLSRYEYQDNHIPPRGNTLIMKTIGESVRPGLTAKQCYRRRQRLYASVMAQIAALLDTDRGGPIRLACPVLTPLDIGRLKKLGFVPKSRYATPAGHTITTMVCGECFASELSMFRRFVMRTVKEWLWNIRRAQDDSRD